MRDNGVPVTWSEILNKLMQGADLTRAEARQAMSEVMTGAATPAQIAGLLVALAIKGESVEEMTGLVEAVRETAVRVDPGVPVVDVVGTGGDGSGTFNISTTAAFVTAGAGAMVAKHGNRSVSSKSGAADVLEALGVPIELPPEANLALLRETGFAFFLAPLYHPAFRHAGPVRRELGVRTVFNFLGPLANPAGARRQAIGVSDHRMAERMIGVLRELGSEYAFVFHGGDGLDEVTTTGPSYIYRLKDGEITLAEFTPEDFGVPRSRPEDLRGGAASDNAAILRQVLEGEPGPHRDVTLVNAAPALVAAGISAGFEEAMVKARASIDEGSALAVLEAVIRRGADLMS